MADLQLLEPHELSRADWDALLRRMADGLDPWAVDLVELVRRFRGYLEEWAAQELEVPGRMVLAGAVLLRMKSEWVRNGNGNGDGHRHGPTLDEVVDQISEEPELNYDVYIAPELRLPVVRRTTGRSTVGDLQRALRAALNHGKRRRRRAEPEISPDDLGMDFEREPFAARAIGLFKRLLGMVNGERVVPFKRLLTSVDRTEQVTRFMELLHLDAEGSVRVYQEEFLGEVLVEVPRGGPGAD